MAIAKLLAPAWQPIKTTTAAGDSAFEESSSGVQRAALGILSFPRDLAVRQHDPRVGTVMCRALSVVNPVCRLHERTSHHWESLHLLVAKTLSPPPSSGLCPTRLVLSGQCRGQVREDDNSSTKNRTSFLLGLSGLHTLCTLPCLVS